MKYTILINVTNVLRIYIYINCQFPLQSVSEEELETK